MQDPYQCIDVLTRIGSQHVKIMLAASAYKLLTVDLNTGNILSTWSAESSNHAPPEGQRSETPEGPPEKKRKVSDGPGPRPNIIKLASSHDGRHVVAVTGEDKCIRVFSLEPDGELKQLSERCMPKRPCAIAITQDDQTIICGDKFGDVYALPLHHSAEDERAFAAQVEEAAAKAFVPTATNLTVHTGRNRKALEAQLKLASQAKTKEPLKFKHELLLGHVSMLIDIALVTLDQEDLRATLDEAATAPLTARSYILTSDRDEHIRVSRGQPQSHVIEGFCLGHREFVSKMCLATPHILVSGGGDDHLFVWDWLKGRLLTKISIRDMLDSMPDVGEFAGDRRCDFGVAVSGIWGIPGRRKQKDVILVACEGLPALLSIAVDGLQRAERVKATAIPLPGNVVDVAVADAGWIIVSLDNTHVPGSTKALRSDKMETRRLQCVGNLSGAEGEGAGTMPGKQQLEAANQAGTAEAAKADEMRELLYGTSKLRKRGGGSEE